MTIYQIQGAFGGCGASAVAWTVAQQVRATAAFDLSAHQGGLGWCASGDVDTSWPRIVAADIAYAVPLTLLAGLGHASLGSVDWTLLGLLLSGSLPGIWLGTRLMRHTPERLVRSLLSVLLAYAGFKLMAF